MMNKDNKQPLEQIAIASVSLATQIMQNTKDASSISPTIILIGLNEVAHYQLIRDKLAKITPKINELELYDKQIKSCEEYFIFRRGY